MDEVEDRVAFVKQTYEQFARDGTLDLDWYTDDFVWDMSTFTGWPEKQEYPGVDGVLEFMTAWIGEFDDWGYQVTDVVSAPGGEVVALIHQSGKARGSGVEVAMDFAQVWRFRDGRFARMLMYDDQDAALASVLAGRGADAFRRP